MANECSGTWKSKLTKLRDKNGPVTPQDIKDGVITIDPHAGSSFTGRHDKGGTSHSLENTNCQGGKISFRRQGDGEFVHYKGTKVSAIKITGEYFTTSGPSDPGDSGTWEANQGGGGGGPLDEGDDDDQGEDRSGKQGRSDANQKY